MTIKIQEDPKSRSWEWNKRYTLLFHAQGSADPAAIATAIDGYITTNAVPVLFDLSAKRVEAVVAADGMPDFCAWNCTWEYAPTDVQTPVVEFDSRMSFSTGGGTKHMTESLATLSSAGGMNFGNLINVTDSGVNGVDVSAPQGKFSFTTRKSWSAVMGDYGRSLVAMTGRINSDAFKGYGVKELLFLGASGTAPRVSSDFTLTFEFAYNPGQTDIAVGDLTVDFKAGWDYLWHFDKKTLATTSGGLTYFYTKPVAAFVEQVYELAAFSALGI